MTSTTHNFVASQPTDGPKSIADPVVAADVGEVRIVLHARALRGERSLREAAALVGLNRDELSRIEKGGTTQIRFETIAKLLSGYGCSLEELMEVTSVPQENERSPYGQVMSYMAEHGEIGSRPTRRAVRRSLELDMQGEEDRVAFESSSTFIEMSGRRRPPLKDHGE